MVTFVPRGGLAAILTAVIATHPMLPRGDGITVAAAASAPSSATANIVAVGMALSGGPATPPGAGARPRLVKVLADWSTIEAQRGTFVWTALDAAISAAARDGMAPTIVLAHTPRWATIGSGVDLARTEIFSRQPPRDIGSWERFVGAAAARYKDRVKSWQVWTQLSLPHFRGTGGEYAALVQAAHRRLRAADGSAHVAMAAPAGVDLTFLVRASHELGGSFDAVSLTAHGVAPETLLRPFAIVGRRVRAQGKAVWLEWTPEGTAAERSASESRAGAWLRVLAVAHAAGVDRVFAAGPAGADADLRQAVAAIGARAYSGYLTRDPDVYTVVFGDGADAIAVAWATTEARTLEIAGTAIRAQTVGGGAAGAPAARTEVREGKTIVSLGLSPTLIAGLPPTVLEEAKATAARGPMMPVVAADRDYSRASEVSAQLGRTVSDERGLYNVRFRTRRNGAVEVVEVGGAEAVRTVAARDVIYVYFDVDDTFMYFAEGRTPVEITIEVWGARAERQVGFNLLYDSTNGYRFTPWQWLEAREGWVKHIVRLSDVSMANTWGFDFAINTSGNRSDDLIVRSVTVKKLTN